MYINQKQKKPLVKAVQQVLKPTYFDALPIEQINEALNGCGFKLVCEDGTDFSAIFCGRDGRTLIQYASLTAVNDDLMASMVDNSSLSFSWHKMSGDKYEITGYIS